MNINTVLNRIKLKLGLLNISTPFEDLDKTILLIIQDITLPVFSQYAPFNQTMVIETDDLERIEKTSDYEKFILPEFRSMELLYVHDVRYDTSTLAGLGMYGNAMPIGTGSMLQQLMVGNASMHLMNTIIPKLTFKFERPRTLTIYNAYYSSKLTLDLGFVHDKSLASIPETASETFMKLAILDVKENLYPTLKQYTEINTAIGNINLKIDDWANAESERADYIRELDDTYHLDHIPMYWA